MATIPALAHTPTTISPARRDAAPRLTAEGNGGRYGIYTAIPMIAYTVIAAFVGFLLPG